MALQPHFLLLLALGSVHLPHCHVGAAVLGKALNLFWTHFTGNLGGRAHNHAAVGELLAGRNHRTSCNHGVGSYLRSVQYDGSHSHGGVVADGAPEQVFTNVDLLRSVGLTVPDTTMLLHELQERGWDICTDLLSVDKCAQAIYDYLSGDN